jgi:hypothetical protein
MKNSHKTNPKSARKGSPDLGHVRCKIRVVIAISNTPASVVQTVGDLRADSSGLLWISTFASLADMFRYVRLNSLKLRVWPAVSSSYAAATYWPSSFLYIAPVGTVDPASSADVEANPRLMGETCMPYVFPQSSLCTSSQWVPRECAATLKVKNSDFTLTAETDRPGCLITQNDGVQNTYGRVSIVKRSAGSGTSTNYDCQMDMDVSFFDIVDPATLTRLMEHRTNPSVQIDPNFLQTAVQSYSSLAMVKSPSTPTTDSKDELILKLKKLLAQ